MTAKRVSVYVDGFNLYHALDDLAENHLKWLDLWALSETLIRADEALTAVKYFSAYATWIPESYRRHQRYVAALQSRGVQFIEGRFKETFRRCKGCGVRYTAHEEKETDVNIGAHLMADGLKDRFDRALVISADTDLNEAVTLARAETPTKQIHIVAPPGRKRRNSVALFEITVGRVRRSLLPEQIIWDGKAITRPVEYDPPRA
ncbi:MAG: NYN domain-containing protein [Methylocystis sp.]|nr:NYN domain-containing protein [Rhodobacter sp.]MCA3586033.1 NYN domain-containing protein [Methylocystis sp.]MCA3461544.1 NYN domain-containing protein [Rhodobacter sp.]MCA3464470.1 NYN domain-containing protein [Rhodobacter sp.]MCA3466279.1 NYN domain-containing protein [Rhodobacter sp.]